MKVLGLICLVVVGFVAAIEDEELLEKWQNYQVQYGKSYRSPVEATKRFGIFKSNMQKIEEHNVLYEQGKVTHTEGINQFTDWTEEEFMEYVNRGLLDRPVIVGEIYNKTENVKVSSIDWRGSGVLTPVKNQGQCGSCWSFSATGGIEGQLGRKGKLKSLSEQNLVDCSSSYGNQGCDGGLMTSAFNYVKDHGIMSEGDYPYRAVKGSCKASSSKIVTRVSGYHTIPSGDESSLVSALSSVGPISVAIDATSHLQSYSSGVLLDSSCNSRDLNHGVLLVGYGQSNGIDYYIVKNSWGASWGESGYFRLGRNKNNPCGIASMAAYPSL